MKDEEKKADDPAAASEPAVADNPPDKRPAQTSKPPTGEKSQEAALEELTIEQQETREQTEPIEKGVETIAKAGASMEKAVASLRKTGPEDALPHQKDALESLKKAVEELKEKEKKLEAALTEEKFSAMKKDQADNRKTTEGISENAVQLGDAGAGARGELIRAAGSMSNAEASFGNRDAASAGTAQGEALASLKYAREQLTAEAEKLLNRLRAEIKKRTIEGLGADARRTGRDPPVDRAAGAESQRRRPHRPHVSCGTVRIGRKADCDRRRAHGSRRRNRIRHRPAGRPAQRHRCDGRR